MKPLPILEKAVAYIEAHLDEDIGLMDVSKETGYSYHHMTRVFSCFLGESVGRYIHKRRLYKAAGNLLHTNGRVLDIALDSGFGSAEAFSRAFKAAFGSSPIEYRRNGADLVVNAKRGWMPEDVPHIAQNISHTPEILVMDEVKLAGIRGATSLSDNRLPQLWEQFKRLHTSYFGTGFLGYGVCETQQTVYAPNGDVSFAVMVGSPVSGFEGLPHIFETKTIRAGRYAVFTHRGSFANLFKTYQYIFGTWLPAAKEELDSREDFEAYKREVSSFTDPNNEMQIYIPIK